MDSDRVDGSGKTVAGSVKQAQDAVDGVEGTVRDVVKT